jgi:hypothetical protein
MLIVLPEQMGKQMLDETKMEKVFTYAVYFLLISAFGLVFMVGWDFTHGG